MKSKIIFICCKKSDFLLSLKVKSSYCRRPRGFVLSTKKEFFLGLAKLSWRGSNLQRANKKYEKFSIQFFSIIKFHPRNIIGKIQFSHFKTFCSLLIWFSNFLIPSLPPPPTGDSIFTAGKPAILTNNTLIRGSKALNNRRPITSSSSTISSQSTNNETGRTDKDRKDKTLKDSMQQRYLMDSGN